MPTPPASDTQIARTVVRELSTECERLAATEGPVVLRQRLLDEAVQHFVALGFPAHTARRELEQELATNDDPVLLLKTLVMQQRIVERLGQTAPVAAVMADSILPESGMPCPPG